MPEHAATAMGLVPGQFLSGTGQLGTLGDFGIALNQLKCRHFDIAAENDFTSLAEKRDLAAKLNAELVVVRGSRHGTPFDSVEVTNASLLALLTDQATASADTMERDTPTHAQALSLAGSIAKSTP